jgi:hypothetical protein
MDLMSLHAKLQLILEWAKSIHNLKGGCSDGAGLQKQIRQMVPGDHGGAIWPT